MGWKGERKCEWEEEGSGNWRRDGRESESVKREVKRRKGGKEKECKREDIGGRQKIRHRKCRGKRK